MNPSVLSFQPAARADAAPHDMLPLAPALGSRSARAAAASREAMRRRTPPPPAWNQDARRAADEARLAVHLAQCECICTDRRALSLLTDEGTRAPLQPFVYLEPCAD